LGDTLSARDRRMVARHLNLCASARKELDRLRGGPVKAPVVSANPPSESVDLKILRWLFKTPKSAAKKESKEAEPATKKAKPVKETTASTAGTAPASTRRHSAWKPVLIVLLIFVGLGFLTHFIQNAGQNGMVKGVQRWCARHGITAFGTSTLDMVLDLTNLPQWGGSNAPVAVAYQEIISDPDHYNVFWRLLEPGLEPPAVDFAKDNLVVFFMGQKVSGGFSVRFKRMENYADKTILWYDEVTPVNNQAAAPSRSWVLQMIPKPAQSPVLVQKIQ
jgi:hypothetical protein